MERRERQSEVRFELNDLLKASAKVLGNGNFENCYNTRLEVIKPLL